MFCPKCGNQIPDGSKFCPKCGSQLGQAPAPAAVPATQPVASPYVAPVKATPGTSAASWRYSARFVPCMAPSQAMSV